MHRGRLIRLTWAGLLVPTLLAVPNVGHAVADALGTWLAHHGLTFFKHPKTKPGAPSQRRPCSNDSDPLTAGHNDEDTPCPYTTRAT